jgi:hypothetical protein
MKLSTTAASILAVLTAAGLSSGTAATAMASTVTSTVQVTGVQLKSALLPAADFPAGYAVSNASDSGGHLATAPAKDKLATMSCSAWQQDLGETGFGETAMATDTVGRSNSNPSQLTLSAYGQLVYQFRTTSAASAFFAGLRAVATRCSSISLSEGGATLTAKVRVVSAARVDGHTAFWIDETESASGFSAQDRTLLTDAGTDVFAVDSTGVTVAPPSSPAPASLIVKLIARVEALR